MIALLAPAVAMAQFQITSVRFLHPDSGATLDETDRMEYFNHARCECDDTVVIEVESNKDPTNSDDRLTIVAGRACLDSNGKIDETECNIIYPVTDVSRIDAAIVIEPTVAELMPEGCATEESLDVIVYVGNTGEWTEASQLGYRADGIPPSQPTKESDPVAGEGLASVEYSAGTSDNETDIKYQILCEKENDSGERIPWSDSSDFEGGFMPPCSGSSAASSDAGVQTADGSTNADAAISDASISDADLTDASATDAGTDADSSDNSVLLQDPRFVCSNVNSGTGKVTIKPLELGVTYHFWAVSFDEAQNVAEPVSLGSATPVPTEDLWERYKRSGGASTGGYCALSAPPSPAWPLMALVLLGIVGLACKTARRRRGRRRK